MAHHDEHEHVTLAEFIEEYWVLFFWGMFFMMTMFMPLLFHDNKNWLYWGIVVTLGIAMALLAYSAFLGKSKKKG